MSQRHRPRKRFGQNFLQSPNVVGQILSSLHLQPEDNVIEIGPGKGALTQYLLKGLNKLTAIEIDRDLQALLCNTFGHTGHFNLICDDALRVDYAQFSDNIRIVGNLPYNIATPLMLYLLTFSARIKDMYFMVQKEVALRLAAEPGTKDYGRLSVMVQYHCEVEYLFEVPPESFYPEPKVDSAVICLRPHKHSPYKEVSMDVLQIVVAKAFSMRRKTLFNNLKPLVSSLNLLKLGIDPGRRPEQISVLEYVSLAELIVSLGFQGGYFVSQT